MELVKRKTNGYSPSFFVRFFYRFSDIIIGLIGCIITLLLIVFVKIAYVKDGDRYPVIYTQERIGLNGKLFKIYKIRTMVPNADKILEDLMAKDEKIREEYNKNKKLENDPRVTRIGNKLRRTSLDEFPQFFNVLIGNMTLVGPRPYLPREIKDMEDTYFTIIQCKPAITGPWQVGGRSEIDFKERCEIDVRYIYEKTLMKDIRIFLRTIKSVILKDGAK